MSTACRSLFRGLVDDAALFPPGNAAMGEAVPAHDDHTSAWYADLVGPFLCPADRLADLGTTLGSRPAQKQFPVGVIVPAGHYGVADAVASAVADPRLELIAVETPLHVESDLSDEAHRAVEVLAQHLPPTAVPYVEVPRAAGWRAALDVLAGAGVRAKLRTGGIAAAAFPSESEVATFVLACLERDLTFKCTAGLHHAVRHTAVETGFEHHGFLNIVLATAVGVAGGTEHDVVAAVAERQESVVADRVREIDESTGAAARSAFASYGTCSIEEPVHDLLALGLLAKE